MKTVSKQTVLKGALLAALATNISWNTATSFATDMASAGEQGRPAAALPAAPAAVTIKPVTPNPSAAVAGAAGPKKDAPAKVEVASTTVTEAQLVIPATVCGVEYKFVLLNTKINDTAAVRGYARRNGSDILSVSSKGYTLKEIEGSQERRDRLTNYMIDAVEQKECAPSIAVEGSPTAPAEQGDDASKRREEAAKDAKEQAEKIARGVRECTLDDKGEALTNDDRLDCHLDRIAGAKEEVKSDDEDRSSRRRGKGRARGGFSASFEFIMNEITSLLHSKKASRVEEGNDLRSSLETALEEADNAGYVSRGTIDTAEARLANLKVGEKVEDRGELLTKNLGPQVQQIDMQINNLRTQSSQNPQMAQMFDSQIKQLENQKQYLATQVQQDQLFQGYTSSFSKGEVGQNEYNSFTADYAKLIAQLSGQVAQPGQNPISGQPSMQAPQGAQQARAALAGANVRSGGISMPAYPQLSVGIPQASPLLAPRSL